MQVEAQLLDSYDNDKKVVVLARIQVQSVMQRRLHTAARDCMLYHSGVKTPL